jgi:hypothetical protein
MNFFTEARYLYRNTILGIRNLKEWFPIMWKDRDWDKDYIMDILIFKLKKNRDYMVRLGHTSNENSIRTMTECIDLLEKIHNEWENYEEPAYKKHEEKWGKSDFYTEPYSENPKLYVLKDRNDERYNPQEIEEKRKDFLLASKIGGHKRKRDFQHAMEIFVNEFDSWWD